MNFNDLVLLYGLYAVVQIIFFLLFSHCAGVSHFESENKRPLVKNTYFTRFQLSFIIFSLKPNNDPIEIIQYEDINI